MTRLERAVLVLLPLTTCTGSPLQDGSSGDLLQRLAAEGCPVPDRLAPAAWRVFEGSVFSFRLPDGFRQVFTQPPGPESALFLRGAESLAYELQLGRTTSADPPILPPESIAECATTLRGRELHLRLARDEGRLVVTALWPHFQEVAGSDRSLWFLGHVDTRDAADDLLAAVLSVRSVFLEP